MKQKLLRALDDARNREGELEGVCVDVPADPSGRWHAKDHLAHLAWWRVRSALMLELARTGGEPPPASPDDSSQNAEIYAATKDLPAADVKREAARTWSALRSAVESSTDDELTRPHPQSPEAQVWEVVPGLGGHLGVHLMFWFMDSGDVERAEAAARWGYYFECGFFPEGEKRADAAYNLACFMARAGRVEEALPLLRDSVRVSAELARWAREDSDLDGIRGDPRVRELLTPTVS